MLEIMVGVILAGVLILALRHASLASLGALKFPVLDFCGENDLPQVLDNNAARAWAIRKIKGPVQIMAPNAGHFFEGHDAALVQYVKDFLDSVK